MKAIPTSKAANVRLWVAQGLLAVVFLFAGVVKFVMPIDVLVQQAQLPGLFIRFIGCAEVLGALGLVMPGLFRIRTELTALAAVGLVLIMTGATTIGIVRGQVGGSILPFVLGVVAAYIAIRRWGWRAPSAAASSRALEQAA